MRRTAKLTGMTLMLILSSATLLAAADSEYDNRLVDARVIEVNESRISVIAQSGVEHVIAIDNTNTKVTKDDCEVSCKELSVGDIVTIELQEENIIKFAKHIEVGKPAGVEVARVP